MTRGDTPFFNRSSHGDTPFFDWMNGACAVGCDWKKQKSRFQRIDRMATGEMAQGKGRVLRGEERRSRLSSGFFPSLAVQLQ